MGRGAVRQSTAGSDQKRCVAEELEAFELPGVGDEPMIVGNSPVAPAGPSIATGEPDLWCTYAAVRTLRWLDRVDSVPDVAATAANLVGRQNSDGGYSWSRGMASDAWATFYCTQALADLGVEVPRLDRTLAWLDSSWTDGAYAMMPGQAPDVWATHFSTRTVVELFRSDVPDRQRLLTWLSRLQTREGGLSWTPEHAATNGADTRACFYGVMAWRALRSGEPELAPPWNVPLLVEWIRAQQVAAGGFRFGAAASVPCMWATYRATATLEALGSGPRDRGSCLEWIMGLRNSAGAFVRWSGYDVADVWASFCAIGSLRALGGDLGAHTIPVVARVHELACSAGGFTYREPSEAGDALSTAAATLSSSPDHPDRSAWLRWLEGCRLPNEGGVMYMPARGSEIRCTLWALAAGAGQGDPVARGEIIEWLRELQNPDGGFGYWHGRGSDLVSTSAAVEILRLLDVAPERAVDVEGVLRFVAACRDGDTVAYRQVPGAPVTLRAGLQALRIRSHLGSQARAEATELLDRHRVNSGGFANEGARMPDLLSSYEAAATADRFGIDIDTGPMHRFLDRISVPQGTAWTPLAVAGGGQLAECLAQLLRRRFGGDPTELPALTLS
ncbi:prenyltransferase/squalene oxidase repeat-containing protein [Nocardia sp. NPDC058499]|uniref:prenyltransferase/squalene oxidase repeat-containing protein n=1 Tax=Nocardia sp. NPDC058499 TaxID=3346530 RepID=UPI00365A87D7